MVQFAPIQKPKRLKATEYDINSIADLLFRRVQELSNQADLFQVVTSDPNGSVTGVFGQGIVFNDGGTARFFISEGGTVWNEKT